MTVASKPAPAITRNARSGMAPSTRTHPTSTARSSPVSATRAAAGRSSGVPRLRASRLPVPVGSRPIATRVPASTSATERTVPSPPHASTTSAPRATASRACPVPGSATVVSNHSGSCQPSSVHTVVTRARVSGSMCIGLATTAGSGRSAGSAVRDSGSGRARSRRPTTTARATSTSTATARTHQVVADPGIAEHYREPVRFSPPPQRGTPPGRPAPPPATNTAHQRPCWRSAVRPS